MKPITRKKLLAVAVLTSLSANVAADEQQQKDDSIERIMVRGKSTYYSNNTTDESMLKQQSVMTSVLASIDNLPGVLINEGDTFGSDDWSTTISMRGFQVNLDEQQIGITVDGIPNGNSNYGGGAKANRYIDTENLQMVEVSQGTADIASRSNEALGGTLNFITLDPTVEQQMTASVTIGDFDARKYFMRYNTGEIFNDTYAWISASSSSNTDWVNESAENTRTHFAGKLISSFGEDTDITAYMAYDDVHEDNYQRVTPEQFMVNPAWDRLTDDWSGIPYIDQVYRRGWSTNRENFLAYLKANTSFGDLNLSGNLYFHDNEGRGDWLPPYIVDVNDDGDNGNSELTNQTYLGGSPIGRLYFVDKDGKTLTPNPGCESSITFPYGGAGAQYDPRCYGEGAVPVGSFRHTHYQKQRVGVNLDFDWMAYIGDMENVLRGGLWFEDYQRDEHRDWHKVIDSRAGYEFNHVPYWVQYDREYPVDTKMFYLQDAIEFGIVSARIGVKKFLVDLERKDKFSGESIKVDSDSDWLLSGGVVVQLPINGLEAFVGYAENFAAIKDEVLERDASALQNIEPETAENFDIGLRYGGDRFSAAITYYDVKFENRLNFFSADSPDGIDYLVGTNGSWVNVGGIDSSGVEAFFNYDMTEEWSLYGSYTYNDSTYVGGNSDYPAGNRVAGSAENMGVLSLSWAKDIYSAGWSSKYVGERFVDAKNQLPIDSYVVSDFYAGVTVDNVPGMKELQINMVINNVTDESYIGGVAGNWGGWIGAPRTASINFKGVF
ncbi:TonB-dependent receptor [Shewanella corallii]|uniref:TonB-dependent receptor n=1 Tax=Shewanella corallii TaxID=560080 RepID=A0ABT0N5U4_9GAMM|nr:TonB-dependent receptor [Shewanella corallii]MCL2913535.1 TonB-dependent receptor [Shewanella corallii]